MKKFIYIFILGTTLLLSGCDKNKAGILFSSSPITKSFSIYDAKVEFDKDQKIYFVFYNPKSFTTNQLRLQVIKIDQKWPAESLSIEYGQDININASNHFVLDYFVIHNTGYYVLRIFSPDNYKHPLIESDFKVN